MQLTFNLALFKRYFLAILKSLFLDKALNLTFSHD